MRRLRLLRSRLWFWHLVLIVSLVVLVLMGLGSFAEAPELGPAVSSRVLAVAGQTALDLLLVFGRIAENDVFGGLLISGCSVLITLAFIHITKIPDIRRTAIRALATGYYENFLIGVVDALSRRKEKFLIIIVLPNFTLIERPNVYWKGFKDVIGELGFELQQEEVDTDFGRSILTVHKAGNPSLPIRVDMPTTMKMLKIILELESDMPVGRGVEYQWWKDRFIELRDEFQRTIEQYLPEDDWGNIVFVKGDTKKEFEAHLRQIMQDFLESR